MNKSGQLIAIYSGEQMKSRFKSFAFGQHMACACLFEPFQVSFARNVKISAIRMPTLCRAALNRMRRENDLGFGDG